MCTGIDAAIFYAIRTFAPYYVALVCGYILSLFVNYFLTIYWTFKSKPNKKNAIGVVLAHLFNLFIVRIGLMFFFVNVIGLSDKVSYVPTLMISVVTNFMIVKFIIDKLK